MKLKLPSLSNNSGQGLIEALVGFGILLLLFHALASLILTSYDIIGNTRVRSTARHLANEQMETVRNMTYNAVGIQGGIPNGDIPQFQTLSRNGLEYTIRTAVIFIDDQFDQLAPNDPYPTDYKRIRVDVSWTGRFTAGESITLISDLASDIIVDGGTLSILVFDADSQPVPQSMVHIVNTAVSPQIDILLYTDDQGLVSLPGSPVCDACYQISISKDGYSQDRTYSTTEVANPSKPHASVVEAMLTEISFTIDKTANFSVFSTQDRAADFALFPYLTFILRGNKTIGTDTLGDPVYKYENQLVTNAAGVKTLENMEWDSYQISMRETDTRDISGTNPLCPAIIFPDTQLDIFIASTLHTQNSLLLAVTDASGSAIASASAHLTQGESYDQTIYTGQETDPDFGQAFFPSLTTGSYNLEIMKSGFEPKSETIEVEGRTLSTTYLNSL